MTQKVNVFYHQEKSKIDVGTLLYKNKQIFFEYAKDFLNTNIELSPYKLPLKSGVHSCEDRLFDGLFGVFADSLPDGWGKLLLDRHLMSKGAQFASITALDRLCYVGEYGIGALSYEPVKEDIGFDKESIVLDDLANSSLNILKGTSSNMLEELLAIGGSSAGARPKIMVQLDHQNNLLHGSQVLKEGFEHYMVKFPSSIDSNDIGKLEYIYSLMAKDAGINIPDTRLLRTKENSYFAIKRFDRDETDNRFHIHSVAGLTHSDFRMPSLDYDDLLSLTFHLTKDINQVKQMMKIAIFNLLTHNRDDHAKNFSFILKDNTWKLSPAYDLTFSFGPGGEHSTMYLGEGKAPTLEHILKLGAKHNIKDIKKLIEEVKSGVSNFKEYAKEYELSKENIELLKNINHGYVHIE